MFLFIHEDGSVVKVKTVTTDDMFAADDGMCQIIDVSVANEPKIYSDSEWIEIQLHA